MEHVLPNDPDSVVETRVVHEAHRRGTTLLARATFDPSAPTEPLLALRDGIVAMLRHHHEAEDHDLWVLLAEAAPDAKPALDALSAEHDRLDAALRRLTAELTPENATTVRDLVHEHLGHEEPVLFPRLRSDLRDGDWEGFSQRIVAGAPPEMGPVFVALLHDVGTEDEIDRVLRHLPPEVRALVPEMRAEAGRVLGALDGAPR